jgi:drug/metabolite transporter (DMT)-like permease
VASAVYYLWGKKFEESYSPNTIVLYMFGISTIFLVILVNPFELARTSLSGTAWFWILNVAFWSGVVGFVPSMFALKYLEASKASIVASIEPVFAVVLAYLVLSEGVNLAQMGGVAMVFLGVILLRARVTSATATASI